jgi:hypothetical protein
MWHRTQQEPDGRRIGEIRGEAGTEICIPALNSPKVQRSVLMRQYDAAHVSESRSVFAGHFSRLTQNTQAQRRNQSIISAFPNSRQNANVIWLLTPGCCAGIRALHFALQRLMVRWSV